jgi:methionyl-tRNA synthetase
MHDKKVLITSALPYVNNIPHLGNLIQVLSADVFARFCRQLGKETLYVCGTDEYGTATETRALEEGITPRELCDRYNKVHTEIYEWFNIAFDKFGRTSTPEHTEITQDIFLKLDKAGCITEKTTVQLYCETDKRFLADRYVRGTCPNCGYAEARGDQCENCGKLLDPSDLVSPRCSVCGNTPVPRETSHLYIDLPRIRPRLEEWMEHASKDGFWAHNAIQMTRSWIRDGLRERSITRDLKWGIPVPKDGYRDKVIYVWFDAPIGYISITATHTSAWKEWWKNPEEVRLYQFIGKDNIPFHTVIFPSSLLGSGDVWTMLYHMSSTEYLNYEGGQFSKSRGIGVFGTDARDTGIPADVWRFYIFYNRPEKADALFTWQSFQEHVNGELIGNLANLVNRTLTFAHKSFDGRTPIGPGSAAFHDEVMAREKRITELLERVELRDAFREIFALSSFGTKAFQDGEPWRTVKTDFGAAGALIHDLLYLVRDLSILTRPYIPGAADRIAAFFGIDNTRWGMLGEFSGLGAVARPEILFKRLEDDEIAGLRERFSGSQKERAAKETAKEAMKNAATAMSVADRFRVRVDLRVARIVDISRHPSADKLYVESIDLGTERRTIVSGLVPYYSEDELRGRNIIVVSNLKPAKLRGVESQGMLLAAEHEGVVDVIFMDDAKPGDRVSPAGVSAVSTAGAGAAAGARGTVDEPGALPPAPQITVDEFFSMPLAAASSVVTVGGVALECNGRPVRTSKVVNGKVG